MHRSQWNTHVERWKDKMQTINMIRINMRNKLVNEDFVVDKLGSKTIEIINASFMANEPKIFGEINEEYVKRELAWYKSQSLNVNDIEAPIPQIWKDVADDEGNINSNYGWCIYSKENGLQFNKVLDELYNFPLSRRAVMIYNRPSMHDDYNKNGMSDFMCTNTVQYLVRENKLHALVYMRSNDVVYGYKNDYAWQLFVQMQLLHELNNKGWLNCGLGNIHWNVGSLHMYERHFKFLL